MPQDLSVDEEKSKWKKRRRLLRKSKNLTAGDAESLMKVPRKQTCSDRKSSIGESHKHNHNVLQLVIVDAVTGDLPSSSSEDDLACQLCPGVSCIADQ